MTDWLHTVCSVSDSAATERGRRIPVLVLPMVEMYEVRWTKQGSGNVFRDGPLSKYRRLLGPRERGKSKGIIQDKKKNRHKFICEQNA
jgi:hypothetical protein